MRTELSALEAAAARLEAAATTSLTPADLPAALDRYAHCQAAEAAVLAQVEGMGAGASKPRQAAGAKASTQGNAPATNRETEFNSGVQPSAQENSRHGKIPDGTGETEDARLAPRETVPLELAHGTSAEHRLSILQRIKVDANIRHPGRQQWGPGFYLAHEIIAQTYVSKDAPGIVRFKDVVLSSLGEVLDCTAGDGQAKWNAFLDSRLQGTSLRFRDLWRFEEQRGIFVQEFLRVHGVSPDVIIAPHEPTFQIVIRTQAAADKLSQYMERNNNGF